MKKVTFIWCVIILTVFCGTAAVVIQHRFYSDVGEIGSALLQELPLNEIAFIRIQSANAKVTLAKEAGQWVVENRFRYRADFSKISDFVKKLQNARIGREFPIRDDIRKRLSLNDPELPDIEDDEKGTRVRLTNKTGVPFANILFGKARRLDGKGFPDSHYIMIDNSKMVYLIDMPFVPLAKTPQEWMDFPIIEVPAAEIQRIECYESGSANPIYVFEREKPDKVLLPKLFPGQETLDETVLKRLEWAITYLPLEDVLPPSVDPETIGLGDSIRLDYHLFNGIIYQFFPCAACDENTPCFVKIEVGHYNNPPVGLSIGGSIVTKELEAKLNKWIYVISVGHHDGFITDIDQLKK